MNKGLHLHLQVIITMVCGNKKKKSGVVCGNNLVNGMNNKIIACSCHLAICIPTTMNLIDIIIAGRPTRNNTMVCSCSKSTTLSQLISPNQVSIDGHSLPWLTVGHTWICKQWQLDHACIACRVF